MNTAQNATNRRFGHQEIIGIEVALDWQQQRV